MFERFRRWSLDGLTPPWGNLPSIYEEMCKGADLSTLPDDALFRTEGGIGWVGGVIDGVLALPESQERERHGSGMLRALDELLERADDANLKNLYDEITSNRMMGSADSFVEQVRGRSGQINHRKLAVVGRYFATRAGHREAVKFGIVLLGVAGTYEDVDMLLRLGGHDEFTLFAAIALMRIASDPEQRIWELAQRVHGWGRIQIVERLEDTKNPQIQPWMLREGFRNSIMNEYLACICARAGRLHEALKAPVIDRPLLDGAADIFRALIAGGPAEGINDYEHAGEAADAYVNLVWSTPGLDLRHFLAVSDLLRYLDDASEQEARRQRGWSAEREAQIKTLGSDILGWDTWRKQVRQGLASNDPAVFYESDMAARKLGISTWEIHFERVRAAPTKSSSWFELLRQTEDDRIDEVLRFAESALPLEQIASGPADKLGLGPEFEAHRALDWLLQELPRFPRRGWPLIRAGLRSPVVRNRLQATRALAAWREQDWPQDAIDIVRQVWEEEPHAETKKALEELLRRKTAN